MPNAPAPRNPRITNRPIRSGRSVPVGSVWGTDGSMVGAEPLLVRLGGKTGSAPSPGRLSGMEWSPGLNSCHYRTIIIAVQANTGFVHAAATRARAAAGGHDGEPPHGRAS